MRHVVVQVSLVPAADGQQQVGRAGGDGGQGDLGDELLGGDGGADDPA
ncbi:MAG TPA: hypothetical protein VH089_10120 [Streptosporangiaceae bacterium]|nr:hypothetical protein [Streptosporangiaceae bacterium]